MHLARALQRSGPEGHAHALALADELIAMGSGTGRGDFRRALAGVSPLRCRSERHGDGASRARPVWPVVGCPGGAPTAR